GATVSATVSATVALHPLLLAVAQSSQRQPAEAHPTVRVHRHLPVPESLVPTAPALPAGAQTAPPEPGGASLAHTKPGAPPSGRRSDEQAAAATARDVARAARVRR